MPLCSRATCTPISLLFVVCVAVLRPIPRTAYRRTTCPVRPRHVRPRHTTARTRVSHPRCLSGRGRATPHPDAPGARAARGKCPCELPVLVSSLPCSHPFRTGSRAPGGAPIADAPPGRSVASTGGPGQPGRPAVTMPATPNATTTAIRERRTPCHTPSHLSASGRLRSVGASGESRWGNAFPPRFPAQGKHPR